MTNGIIYIAEGDRFLKQAVVSAKSVKQHMPGMPITLFCSAASSDFPDCFDSIEQAAPADEGQYMASQKIHALLHSPYEQTLYLDTDTYVCTDISDLFEWLEHFDVAAALRSSFPRLYKEGIPRSFPEYNGGVILYRNSKLARALLEDWYKRFWEDDHTYDQPALRAAIYFSDARVGTLPEEYNCRATQFGGHIRDSVKIIHGHHDDLPRLAQEINADKFRRLFIYDGKRNGIRLISSKQKSVPQMISDSIQYQGVWRTIAAIFRKLLI